MARKKRRSRSRRSRKVGKKVGGKSKKTPVTFAAGTAYTVYKAQTRPLVSGNLTTYQWNAIKGLWNPVYKDYTAKVGTETAYSYKTYGKPMLIGALVSYGHKLPIVGKLYQRVVQKHLNAAAREILGKGYKA